MPSGVNGSRQIAPFTISAVLHGVIALLLFNTLKERKPVALPPMYRVEIVAAPAGERAIGEVKTEQANAAKAVTQPNAAQSTVKETPVPTAKPAPKTPARVTPSDAKSKPVAKAGAPDAKATPQAKTEAPKAGGGPVGDKGTDVATVRSDGIEFPFPGYLNNIVRQIAIRFKPRNAAARLKAEVRFLVHRDGSVSGIEVIRKSGNYSFDLEATGAVDAASTAHAFGPLPDGFPDDVLPVVFAFDPAFLK
jgi:protein TonB